MSENIVLTKIAKESIKYQNENYDQIKTFQYKGKKWVLIDAFKEDEKILLELIKTYENIKVKNFGFVPSDDGKHVIVVYRNIARGNRHQISKKLFNQLLELLYSNFQRRHVESYTHETKILKTYVTTTLFEVLQQLHTAAKAVSQQMLNSLAMPAKFLPTLCEYQKKSVLWLLMRERDPCKFPAFFEKLQAKDNETVVYKHLYSGYIQIEPPPDICLPPGGILADEMGLGKTIEMLSLILLNPRIDVCQDKVLLDFFEKERAKRKNMEPNVFCICTSDSIKNIIQCKKCFLWQHKRCIGYDIDYDDDIHKPYLCPCCWQIAIDVCGVFKTKATFIVSPNTIKLQWLSEIKRHINPALRVFLYDGMLTGKWISPWELSEYDVVLTDYNVLRSEIYFTQDNVSERTTRNKPRSMRMNTPILMLEWWRVLLDEAQMVESNTAKVATIVRMIPAINRWAVTGTPIQKSLNDLHPLLQFIGFDAVSDTATWNCLVNDFVLQQEQNCSEGGAKKPVPELINVLQKCMWRTCKTQITLELKIPPQQEIVHRIEFDNLEKLFYNEQHSECKSNFMVNVNKYTKRMKTISPQIMKMILQPFLKIRQTCTIPVVINSSHNNNVTSHQQKQFLQPKELHSYLKSSNEISCKTELRAMASSHNGLAALYFLQKEYDIAIKHYESVLKLANDYNHMNVAVDSLLQIHALHNIMQIKIIKNSEAKDLFLETYETQYNALEWKYLGTYASTLSAVKISYEAAVDKINEEIEENFLIYMANDLEILQPNDESFLLQKIHEECMPRFGQTNLKLSEIQSARSLMYVVQLWFHKLTEIFKVVRFEITALKYFIENVRSRNQVSPAIWRDVMHLVNTVYDCHLSEIREVKKPNSKTPEKKKQLCKMCCIRDSINTFECLLFDKVIDIKTNYTDGLKNPSFEMFLCKLTLNFLKSKHRESTEIMDNNWLYLENLQLVCTRLIKLWIEIEYTIKAYDELNMCKMRITLTNDPDNKSVFKILKNDIGGRILEQQNELMDAQTQFTVKLARLKYIRHLEGDDNPGACPICRLTEDDRYAVLECGHHICYPCLKSIRQYVKGSHFKCSICRNVQQNKNIYYVSRTKIKTSERKIKGDYSSKITCIVRLILKLKNEKQENSYQISSDIETNSDGNNDIKILIFSQWEPILLAIAFALKENDIKFRTQCTAKTIAEFKNPNLGISCLLIPFVKGSKGLNLVEATHVFLVEPILNPGEELQAIGRVHRFGQTKTTTVHRFIVRDSIEENIYNFIVSSLSNSTGIQRRWEFDNISLKDFENLFSLQQKNEC